MKMLQQPPPRPSGDSSEAIYHQWVWDMLTKYGVLVDTPEIQFSATSFGIVPRVKRARGGSSERSLPVYL